jgi:hypothetical protein
MAEKLNPKETVSILELTVSHMWSIAGLVEVLERKGVLTKQGTRSHHRVTPAHSQGRASQSSP